MDKSRSLKPDMVTQARDPNVWRLRQNCCDLKASLCYKVRFCHKTLQKEEANKLKANQQQTRTTKGRKKSSRV